MNIFNHHALKICFLAILAPVLLAWGSSPAHAGAQNCSISSNGIIFSGYNTVSKQNVDSVGTLTITCSGVANGNMKVELSGGNTGSCANREMRQGSAILNYQLYTDASRTQTWCSGTQSFAFDFGFQGGGDRTKIITYYGSVFANQNPQSTGAYTDSLLVTVRDQDAVRVTTMLTVSGSVLPSCSVGNASLPFGSYNSLTTVTGSSSIAVNCSNGASYSVSLSGGQNSNGSSRRMAGSGNFLTYGLFQNSGMTVSWGNGTSFGSAVTGTGNGSSQSLQIYGRILNGQLVPLGSYSDTVVITVAY